MKKIVSYEGLDGNVYRTQQECLIADAKFELVNVVRQCTDQLGIFSAEDFVTVLQNDSELKKTISPIFAVKATKQTEVEQAEDKEEEAT